MLARPFSGPFQDILESKDFGIGMRNFERVESAVVVRQQLSEVLVITGRGLLALCCVDSSKACPRLRLCQQRRELNKGRSWTRALVMQCPEQYLGTYLGY